MVLTLLRMAAFLLSMGGYVLWMSHRSGIRPEFAPALFCAGASGVLFAAGILNMLYAAVWLLFAGGLVALACCLRDFARGQGRPGRRELAVYGLFLLAAVYFAALLWGIKVNEYDNFSHYATVLKDMLRSDAMPSFKSVNIMFQAYPLGSTLFLYYLCRIAGAQEHLALWGQLLITLSGALTLSAFIKKERAALLPPLAFGLFALLWRADFNSLTVDTILPVTAAASFAMLYYYRNEAKKASALALLMLPFVVNIKNSGLFYAVICLLCLWFWLRPLPRRQRLKAVGLPAAACAALLLIWQRHTVMVYLNASNSKHAMNLRRLLWIFREKSFRDMLRIGKAQALHLLSPDGGFLPVLLLLTLALAAGWLLCKNRRSAFLRAGAFVWGVYLVYQASLYGMYLMSMPIEEALIVAGYERYVGSLLVFVLGAAAVLTMDAFEGAGLSGRQRPLAWLALLLFFLPSVPFLGKASCLWSHAYHQRLYEETDRYLLDQVIESYSLPEGKNYLLYTENSSGYLYYLARYDLWTSEPDAVSDLDREDLPELLAKNDYLVLLYNTEEIRSLLAAQGYTVPDDGLPTALKLH